MMTGTHKGQWSREEDERLEALVRQHGAREWKKFAGMMGGVRSAKQCRERWHQNLDPQLNHQPISTEEGKRICELVEEHGQKWARIARDLHNHRSDNHVKNWWNGSHNRAQRAQASTSRELVKSSIARTGPVPCRPRQRDPRPLPPFSHDILPPLQPMMALPHSFDPYAHLPPSSSLSSRATVPAPLNLSTAPIGAYPNEPSNQYQYDLARAAHPYYAPHPSHAHGRFISPPYSEVPSIGSGSGSSVASNAPSTPHSATFPPYHNHYLPDHIPLAGSGPSSRPGSYSGGFALPPVLRKSEDLATAHDLLNMAAGPRMMLMDGKAVGTLLYESPPVTPAFAPGKQMGFESVHSSPKDGRMDMRALLN